MKLLLDANISWRLIAGLKNHFDDCRHVDFLELIAPLSDIAIWNYAMVNDLIIVTNDDDFLNLLTFKKFPPKVILLRTGNQSNNYIEKILIKHKINIKELNNSTDYGLLEIFDI